MATSCEFRNCNNTSEDTKVNRLKIHENLARKWDQVFNENLTNRIGDYLYICCAHFDINTKKLILPKPIKEPGEIIKEAPKVVERKEIVQKSAPKSQKKTVFEAPVKSKNLNSDSDDDEPLLQKNQIPAVSFPTHIEQTFIEVEMDPGLVPEIKEEAPEEENHVENDDHWQEEPRERSPVRQEINLKAMVPLTMQPKVLLGDLKKVKKRANVLRDKKRYEKKKRELQKVLFDLEKAKMKNELMQKDILMTRNRINFIEINFGGAASKRNNPDFLDGNEL
ncbi:uncharacterized protein LOC134832243 [Culicoides brevitarsis]|uniref:uncharacterized protein LOC134832243 n=1 Tax=Culicoides brevitarsis TaxID=469753 RepID=UPI00307C1207